MVKECVKLYCDCCFEEWDYAPECQNCDEKFCNRLICSEATICMRDEHCRKCSTNDNELNDDKDCYECFKECKERE